MEKKHFVYHYNYHADSIVLAENKMNTAVKGIRDTSLINIFPFIFFIYSCFYKFILELFYLIKSNFLAILHICIRGKK